MPEIPELKITDADLVNVMPDRKLTTPEAKKIIGNTKKVLIEGIEAKAAPFFGDVYGNDARLEKAIEHASAARRARVVLVSDARMASR